MGLDSRTHTLQSCAGFINRLEGMKMDLVQSNKLRKFGHARKIYAYVHEGLTYGLRPTLDLKGTRFNGINYRREVSGVQK